MIAFWAMAQPIEILSKHDVCFRLEAMEMADQEVRQRWIEAINRKTADLALVQEMHFVDRQDTDILKEIVARYGWPTIGEFGRDCSHSAWLLVQHADHDVRWQEHVLKLMKPLVRRRQARGDDYAMLIDRVRAAHGQKQLYGTGFDIKDGKLVLKPQEDPAHLDERRRRVGLMPMKQYRRLAEEAFKPRK